jgi:hypothetical protein
MLLPITEHVLGEASLLCELIWDLGPSTGTQNKIFLFAFYKKLVRALYSRKNSKNATVALYCHGK